MEIAKVYKSKNGNIKVKFDEMGVYELLKEMGFSYSKINKKDHFFREIDRIKSIVTIKDINEIFHNHLKENFDTLEINGSVVYKIFIDEYYKNNPIKNSSYIRTILDENYGVMPYVE